MAKKDQTSSFTVVRNWIRISVATSNEPKSRFSSAAWKLSALKAGSDPKQRTSKQRCHDVGGEEDHEPAEQGFPKLAVRAAVWANKAKRQ